MIDNSNAFSHLKLISAAEDYYLINFIWEKSYSGIASSWWIVSSFLLVHFRRKENLFTDIFSIVFHFDWFNFCS